MSLKLYWTLQLAKSFWAKKKIGNKGVVIGPVAATVSDLDVALYLIYDKCEMTILHRDYSHSILFSIIRAFLIGYFLQRLLEKQLISFKYLDTELPIWQRRLQLTNHLCIRQVIGWRRANM